VRPVSARRQAVAAATGVPTEAVAPPTELPVNRISLNPDNPRSSLGDLTDLAGSLKDHGQKVAIAVMNRDAYVRINPGKESDLEADTTYVVLDGSSRLAAARDAGLATIKVMVDDNQGEDQEGLLESALVANIHRQDLDPLDEARALERLLKIHGSQRALAKRLHRSQGWVSQRLALLGLNPELTEALERGTENVDLLRAVGNKPKDQQQRFLSELKTKRAAKEATAQRPSQEGRGDTPAEGDYGVITPRGEGVAETVHNLEARPPKTAGPEPSSNVKHVPEPRTVNALQPGFIPEGSRLPYDDGATVGMHLAVKMDEGPFLQALQVMSHRSWDKVGTHAGLDLVQAMLHKAAERDVEAVRRMVNEFLEDLSAKVAQD